MKSIPGRRALVAIAALAVVLEVATGMVSTFGIALALGVAALTWAWTRRLETDGGRAAAAMPDRFAGLVFLSPAIEHAVLNSPAFADGWKGRPVLVVQGGRDHNVKPHTVTAAVELMRANGAEVTYHLDPDADHFLFFAKLDETHRRIAEWMPR